jgi:putative PEP-CTERM system TPR-repeat lipoprotein
MWSKFNSGVIRAAIVAVVVGAFIGGCAKSPEELLQSANERESRGDHSGAILDLKTAIQQAPEDRVLRFKLGSLYNETLDAASAEKELRRASNLGLVEGGRVTVELARALRWQSKYTELLEEIKPEPVYEPANLATIHALRGRAQLSLGNLAAAKQSLVEARAIAPDVPDVGLLHAQIYVAEGKLDEALALVEKVLAGAETHFDALIYRASILRALRRSDEELSAYNSILKSRPNHFGALWSRSMWYFRHGKLAEAEKDLSLLAASNKENAQVVTQQGVLYLAKGKTGEAVEKAQFVLKHFPDFAPAWLLLGMAQLERGQPHQAEQVLSKYVAKYPNAAHARAALAATLIELKQPQRAVELLEPVVRTVESARYYELLGRAFSLQGEHTKALTWFEKAVALAPRDPAFQFSRAMAQIKTGNLTGGLSGLEEAAQLTGSATPTDELLVLASLSYGKVDRAADAVAKLEARAPQSPITYNLKGLVQLAQGNSKEATGSFEKSLKLDPKFFPAARNLAQLDVLSGDASSAAKRYEVVLKADPGSVDAVVAKSNLDVRLGHVASAVESLQDAIRRNPEASIARALLVRIHLSRGEKQQAVTVANDGLALSPNDLNAVLLAAETELAAGNANSAVQTGSRLVQIAPKSADAHFQLGRLQLAAQRTQDAQSSLQKALTLQPDYMPAQLGLVSMLVQSNKPAEAIAFAKKVQTDQPRSTLGLVLEGEIHEHLGKYAEALESYRKALKLKPASAVAIRVFRVAKRVENRSSALAELQTWLERNPADKEVRSVVAFELIQDGKFAAAVAHYEQLRKQDPRNAEYANGLAWAYHLAKDSRAKETAEAAYALAPTAGYTADTLGWILVQQGDVKRALEMLKFASASSPDAPEIRYHLAVALQQSGRTNEARKELRQALAANREFSEIERARAMLKSLE